MNRSSCADSGTDPNPSHVGQSQAVALCKVNVCHHDRGGSIRLEPLHLGHAFILIAGL